MKAYVVYDYPTMLYNVYLYNDYQNARIPLVMDNGLLHATESIPVGAEMDPTFRLDPPTYQALQAAMIGDAIDNDDALKDTRKVRDRLLTMVESEWQSRQLEKH